MIFKTTQSELFLANIKYGANSYRHIYSSRAGVPNHGNLLTESPNTYFKPKLFIRTKCLTLYIFVAFNWCFFVTYLILSAVQIHQDNFQFNWISHFHRDQSLSPNNPIPKNALIFYELTNYSNVIYFSNQNQTLQISANCATYTLYIYIYILTNINIKLIY